MSLPTPPNEKVTFFFVGVGKCGTSWLYAFFKRHELLSLPSIKEPYLIDTSKQKREKRVRSLYTGNRKKADFSNLYYWDQQNPQKIKAYNPDAKIIFTTRKPSDRIVSHFAFLKRNADIHAQGKSLAQYLENGDPEHLVQRSDYPPMIDRYVAQFGTNNILLLPLEQLKNTPQHYTDRLLKFLQLPPITVTPEDTTPVLKRSTARNPILARKAKWIAVLLRKLGLLRILGILKESLPIRHFLFREIQGNEPIDRDFGTQQEAIDQLDRDYQNLLDATETLTLFK